MNYTEYLEKCLAAPKTENEAEYLDTLRWMLLSNIGSLCGGYAMPKVNKGVRSAVILDALSHLLHVVVCYGHLHEMDELLPYLEGIKQPYVANNTDMAVVSDMFENAISLTKSSRHNPYLTSLLERVLFGLIKLAEDNGLTLNDLMDE